LGADSVPEGCAKSNELFSAPAEIFFMGLTKISIIGNEIIRPNDNILTFAKK
jgi:hypothetical protein